MTSPIEIVHGAAAVARTGMPAARAASIIQPTVFIRA